MILATSYVPGTTRHPLLDTLVLGAFAAMIIGLLLHGLGRLLTRGRHRNNSDDGKNGEHHG